MKKTFTAILIALLASVFVPKSANSQVIISLLFGEQLNSGKMEFGLITGFNASTLVGLEDPKYLTKFKLGLFLDYNFSENWIGSFEANVKNTLGSTNILMEDALFPIQDSILESSGKTERRIAALQVPLYMNYRFKNGFSIGAGGYLSYQHGTRDVISYSFQNTDYTIEQSFTEHINKIDAGLVGALGYHLPNNKKGGPGLSFRFKTSYGLTNVFKADAPVSAHNLWFSFDVAIPIIMSVF